MSDLRLNSVRFGIGHYLAHTAFGVRYDPSVGDFGEPGGTGGARIGPLGERLAEVSRPPGNHLSRKPETGGRCSGCPARGGHAVWERRRTFAFPPVPGGRNAPGAGSSAWHRLPSLRRIAWFATSSPGGTQARFALLVDGPLAKSSGPGVSPPCSKPARFPWRGAKFLPISCMRCWRPRCRFVSPATWRILSFESTQSWWSIGPPVILIESMRAVSLEATSCPLPGVGRPARRWWDEADHGCPGRTLYPV